MNSQHQRKRYCGSYESLSCIFEVAECFFNLYERVASAMDFFESGFGYQNASGGTGYGALCLKLSSTIDKS